MVRHHCGTYSTDTYCSCFDQRGVYLEHYKQFNENRQTYECCDKINVSLSELYYHYGTSEGASINDPPYEFFQNLYTKKLSGCSFHDYFVENGTSSTNNFIKNYKELYYDYQTVTAVYNNFVAGKSQPSSTIPNYVKCEDPNHIPYILEYKSPNQVYYNNSYICSQKKNNVFTVIDTGYGRLNYNIKRFWNYETNKPCIESSCRLKIDNYGNIANQGNQSPVYENVVKSAKNFALGSLIASSILIFLWFVYVLVKTQSK